VTGKTPSSSCFSGGGLHAHKNRAARQQISGMSRDIGFFSEARCSATRPRRVDTGTGSLRPSNPEPIHTRCRPASTCDHCPNQTLPRVGRENLPGSQGRTPIVLPPLPPSAGGRRPAVRRCAAAYPRLGGYGRRGAGFTARPARNLQDLLREEPSDDPPAAHDLRRRPPAARAFAIGGTRGRVEPASLTALKAPQRMIR
jgi:hypothetical protein